MNKRGEEITKDVYYSKNEVYLKYRELIQSINSNLWDALTLDVPIIDKQINLRYYPFFTEMLLFNMADDVVFNDIINRISINIE